MPGATGWLDTGAVPPEARCLLVMMPYAGAMALPVAALRAGLPPDVAVLPLHLPGHGTRAGEPLLDQPAQLIDGALAAVRELPRLPLVLCGYSMGARLAYEVAARLVGTDRPVAGLIACCARGPHSGTGHPAVSHLPPDRFLAAAVDIGLAAPELARLPDVGDLVGALHADMRVVETFPVACHAPLPVPAVVIGARSDWLVPEPALRGWDRVFAAPATHLRVAGGHLAIQTSTTEFVHTVAEGLAAVRAAGERSGW